MSEQTKPSVAIAIPAHNEAEAIGEFIAEIDAALEPRVSKLTFVVVDDKSSDGTGEAVQKIEDSISGVVVVVRQEVNQGHGPTLLEAYRKALDTGADLILQVDGDGQFLGSDLRRILVLLEDGAESVCGVRRFRYDPWFRMLMTRVVRWYVALWFGVSARDTNCPLRGYRAPLLDELMNWVPDKAMVPNLYLTILASRRGATMVEVDVNHRVRRGTSATGTMWGNQRKITLIPGRLVKFSSRALRESLSFHSDINSGRRPAVSAGRR